MTFGPCTTGEALKWKVMLVPPTPSPSAGVPLTVKSLGWTLAGSTGALIPTTKSVSWVKTVLSQGGWEPITVHCASLADGDAAAGCDGAFDIAADLIKIPSLIAEESSFGNPGVGLTSLFYLGKKGC